MAEEWREIPNADYSVSSEGRIASRKKGRWWVMRSSTRSNGYPHLHIFVDGGRKDYSVHELVALCFLGPKPSPSHQINHKNGIKADNRADNLEWVTCSENHRHRFDILGQKTAHGEDIGSAKVTEAGAREICRRCAAGEMQKVVAADYGITQSSVSRIVRGETWGWLGK